MAITPNNYAFTGGAFMGGGDTPVARDDIHTLTLTKNGESIGNYNPLVGNADIEIPSDGVTEADLPLKITGNKVTNGGTNLTVRGDKCWAEGENTTAGPGTAAHAEGHSTVASNDYSHSEGNGTVATGEASHVEGHNTRATARCSHAEGEDTHASGPFSHAGGKGTVAGREYSTAIGRYNKDSNALFSVGDGSSGNARSDAFKVDANGETWVKINGVLTKVTNVSGGGGGSDSQFVLVRSDMTTNFTNEEYQDCTDAITAGQAVCVQFVRNSRTFQAQLTQVEPDTGLLVFEVDVAHIHITYEVSGTSNAHSITESDYQNGTIIFDTLHDAITWNVVLHNGDIFETNGFHTSGDGGAARYKVSSTGTANGMDIIQLAAGKLAVLQAGDWIVPEQLGYEQSYSRNDVVPYIQRAIAMGCQHIHLRSSGNGAGYTWKTKLTVTGNGFKLTGEGDWGYPNKFTYIVFGPTDATVDAMIDMKARDVVMKDLDIEVTGDYVKAVNGITNTGYDSDANRFWEFDNIRFNSFDNCIKLAGGIKWQNTIKNCLFNSCKIGLHIYESSTFELIVENCLFTNCDTNDVFVEGNLFAAIFTSCGFGSQGTAIALSTNSDNYMYQNIRFQGCNFEIDRTDLSNMPAIFLDCFPNSSHPYIRQNITIANCHFTPIKITYPDQGTTNRYVRLGPKTHLLLIENQILGKDEPQNPTWILYPKLIWNETSLPTYGSIVECGANTVGNGFFEYPDALLPYVTRNTQARSLVAQGAISGVDSAISDCDTFIPKYSGEVIVGRASTYESTAHMPTTSIFGFIFSMGCIVDPNKRVLQYMIASNSNMYTRIGRDTGGGWQFDAWKTIAAS